MPDDIRLPPVDDVSGDEPVSNTSANAYFGDILSSRRAALLGSIGAAIGSFIGTAPREAAAFTPAQAAVGGPTIDFKAIPVNNGDSVVVPEGYSVQVILPQGTPLNGQVASRALVDQTGADAATTVGAHHDGMHFFPIEGREPDQGHCQVVGLMGAFDHTARHPLMFTLHSGRTSPAARPGKPWRGHCGTRSRSSDAAADGSGHRSSRGMRGSAAPARVT